MRDVTINAKRVGAAVADERNAPAGETGKRPTGVRINGADFGMRSEPEDARRGKMLPLRAVLRSLLERLEGEGALRRVHRQRKDRG